VALGLLAALLLLCGFVPIASGTLGMGQIAVDGERKVVQHASGGIVAEIFVKEGDAVQMGDILLRLDAVQAGAAAGVVQTQLDALRAEEAVRMAEAADRDTVMFPADLVRRRSDPRVDSILKAEMAAFGARRDRARSDAVQLDEQLIQIDRSIAAATTERSTQTKQAELFAQELTALQPLMEKGLTLRSRLLALERSLESARGQISALTSDIEGLEAKARETRELRERIGVDRRTEATEALRKIRAAMGELMDRQIAADDTLQRTDVRSPTEGIVMAMRINTLGGVVEPGQPIMEIVPQSDQLVTRVRIPPADADNVRQGMAATVRLSAGGGRQPIQVDGSVQSISADALSDSRTGEPYFEARIAMPKDRSIPSEILAPGLPAEVLIKTGEHTILDYLFSPVERAMFRSLRDS
jgi:HlyD family type I secretion membrane fusion protein